jgi:hypothetical protein
MFGHHSYTSWQRAAAAEAAEAVVVVVAVVSGRVWLLKIVLATKPTTTTSVST